MRPDRLHDPMTEEGRLYMGTENALAAGVIDVKPCAHCGEDDPQFDEACPGVVVMVCQGCGMIGPHDSAVPQDAPQAVAKWNERGLSERIATDLLEALRPFANFACSPSGECDCFNCKARAAIAKATGVA